jgi:hypothetical protein
LIRSTYTGLDLIVAGPLRAHVTARLKCRVSEAASMSAIWWD